MQTGIFVLVTGDPPRLELLVAAYIVLRKSAPGKDPHAEEQDADSDKDYGCN